MHIINCFNLYTYLEVQDNSPNKTQDNWGSTIHQIRRIDVDKFNLKQFKQFLGMFCNPEEHPLSSLSLSNCPHVRHNSSKLGWIIVNILKFYETMSSHLNIHSYCACLKIALQVHRYLHIQQEGKCLETKVTEKNETLLMLHTFTL